MTKSKHLQTISIKIFFIYMPIEEYQLTLATFNIIFLEPIRFDQKNVSGYALLPNVFALFFISTTFFLSSWHYGFVIHFTPLFCPEMLPFCTFFCPPFSPLSPILRSLKIWTVCCSDLFCSVLFCFVLFCSFLFCSASVNWHYHRNANINVCIHNTFRIYINNK